MAPPSPPPSSQLRRRTQINRIKLSRELMVRLSLALNQDDQRTVPAGRPISRLPERPKEAQTQTETQIQTRPLLPVVQQSAWKRTAKIRLDGSNSSACKATRSRLANRPDNQRQCDNWPASISSPSNCDGNKLEKLERAQEVSMAAFASASSSTCSSERKVSFGGQQAKAVSPPPPKRPNGRQLSGPRGATWSLNWEQLPRLSQEQPVSSGKFNLPAY